MRYENWLFGRDGALLRAATLGNLPLVEELIKGGANVNIASCNGITPLHRAAEHGHMIVVKHLLLSGAKADAVSKTGQTARSLALASGHQQLATLLSPCESK